MDKVWRNESHLEKYIVDFVWDKVTERVRLYLADDITVRPVKITKKGGAYLLATFWCNVLQHKSNYPPSSFHYLGHTASVIAAKSGDVLELKLEKEGVRIYVDMKSGSLTVCGRYVYDWFTTRFKCLLDNFDREFADTWIFSPTPVGDLPETSEKLCKCRLSPQTETESYLLLEGRGRWPMDQRMEEKLENNKTRMIPHVTDVRNHKLGIWSAVDVDRWINNLIQNGGGLYDSYNQLYALWRSILHRWMAISDGSTVYIATPIIDADRLADLVEIRCQYRESDVKFGAIFVNVECDPCQLKSQSSCGSVQRAVLSRYDATQQTYAEHHVLRCITYPVNKEGLNAAFTARVTVDGRAEILLTSASYHARDLSRGKLSSITFIMTTAELFRSRYLSTLETPAVMAVSMPAQA